MNLLILLLFLAALVAFWLSALAGGGASLILIPLLSRLLPLTEVPFALTAGTFTSSAARIAVFWKHIHWRIFRWFVPFSMGGVLAGAWLIKYLNPLYLELTVALLLLMNLPELLRRRQSPALYEQPYPAYVLALVGSLAGFVSGVTGAIGLLFNRFYLRYGLSKESIIATRAANEIILHLLKLLVYFLLELYSRQAIIYGLIIAIASILSSYTVRYILRYVSDGLFRRIGYGAMVVSGFFLFQDTLRRIAVQDNLALYTNAYGEAVLNWRKSQFVLEFSLDEGLEIERQIRPEELPENLRAPYEALQMRCETLIVEKVLRIHRRAGYEFYCWEGRRLRKIEIEV